MLDAQAPPKWLSGSDGPIDAPGDQAAAYGRLSSIAAGLSFAGRSLLASAGYLRLAQFQFHWEPQKFAQYLPAVEENLAELEGLVREFRLVVETAKSSANEGRGS